MTMREPAASPMSDPVLAVSGLRVDFDTEEGVVRAVDGVDLTLRRGGVTALVGESGCGKSVTAYSILRLIEKPGRIVGGTIIFRPRGRERIDIAALGDRAEALYALRGGSISMIFQEPMTALSPVHTIGDQLCEAVLLHRKVSARAAQVAAIDMLRRVGVPGAARRMGEYPFEMSGGMRQRVVIAMALVCRPEILIADEPTTAVDVTIQAQILALMRSLQEEMGTSILLITHDLGVVAQLAEEVAVMYLGRIVERGGVRDIMKAPRHPYTRGMLASLPSLSLHQAELPSIEGSVPGLNEVPPGCPFHPRCPEFRAGLCDTGERPLLRELAPGHFVACTRAEPSAGMAMPAEHEPQTRPKAEPRGGEV
jgi:oligopeptide/dipeptide ABC transporter ATP-binding protein